MNSGELRLKHIWAVQTLKHVDMTQPSGGFMLAEAIQALCPELSSEDVWYLKSYGEILTRVQDAAREVIAASEEVNAMLRREAAPHEAIPLTDWLQGKEA